MRTNRQNLRALFCCAILGLGAQTCVAQEAEIAPGQAYNAQLRASLQQQGWKPDASYGLKIANGAPLYRFPEVLCGPQLCRAKWRDRAGKERVIMIQRAFNNEEYRIAPQ